VNRRSIKICLADAVTKLTWRLAKPRATLESRIPVLCYHRVLPGFIEGNDPIYTVLPEQFESQMAYLSEAGFNSLSLQEFAATARGARQPDKRSVLITFDDGYADNYQIAWPIAKKYKVKINLFLCTSYINQVNPLAMNRDGYQLVRDMPPGFGGRSILQQHMMRFSHLWRPLNWSEIREMHDSGVQMGFHSHSHRNLALLPPSELATDIATGLLILQRELGYRPGCFALPYGWYDSYNSEVLSILKNFGIHTVFACHLGSSRTHMPQPAYPRLTIYQEDDLDVFQRKLHGAYDWLARVERWEYRVRSHH
jgi:peptidoglycan/xylan/chitin deacetylase (PgdA/CDA1 family)